MRARDSLACGFALALLVGCGTDPVAGPDTTTDMSGSATSSGPSTQTSSESTDSMGDSEAESDEEAEATDFVPTGPDIPPDCSIWEQDCGEGLKCVPWYESDGAGWRGFTCVPVLGEQAEGEPCTIDFADSSDDCDATSSCFSLEHFQGSTAGTCHTFCDGSADNPSCEGAVCIVGNGYPGPGLCMPDCNPALDECGELRSCEWWGNVFGCAMSEGGEAVGEACGHSFSCEAGSLCTAGESLPNCEEFCCAPFCLVSEGDAGCGALPGTSCVPFYEEGMDPPGLDDLGLCVLPEP